MFNAFGLIQWCHRQVWKHQTPNIKWNRLWKSHDLCKCMQPTGQLLSDLGAFGQMLVQRGLSGKGLRKLWVVTLLDQEHEKGKSRWQLTRQNMPEYCPYSIWSRRLQGVSNHASEKHWAQKIAIKLPKQKDKWWNTRSIYFIGQFLIKSAIVWGCM